jgi:long-chain acyl-CoA synthetase
MLNLAMMLEESAATLPGRDALVAGGTRLTYAEVNAAANQVANLLAARGIGRGDTVALASVNIPQFPIVYYGILKAGAAVVPFNVLLKGREIAYHLTDSDAKAFFCFAGGPRLPLGEEGRAGFDATPGCEHFFLLDESFADLLAELPTTPSCSTPAAPPAPRKAPSSRTPTCCSTR